MNNTNRRTLIQAALKNNGGKFFGATFVKRNGETRKINCRTGVSIGVKGTGRGRDLIKSGMITVWDTQKAAFRTINTGTLSRLSFDHGILLLN